ncbi:hypothetical protein PMAYCL1PPCAC_19795, partial [Pristionchus mayeri]
VLVTGRINYLAGSFSHVDMDENEVDLSEFGDIQKSFEYEDDGDTKVAEDNKKGGDAFLVRMSARAILNILEGQGWKAVCIARSTEAAGTQIRVPKAALPGAMRGHSTRKPKSQRRLSLPSRKTT